jgi:hypothetical protein
VVCAWRETHLRFRRWVETEVSGLVLNPSQNQLSVDFVGLGFAAGEALRYQYRLAGADPDWSALTDQRTSIMQVFRQASTNSWCGL